MNQTGLGAKTGQKKKKKDPFRSPGNKMNQSVFGAVTGQPQSLWSPENEFKSCPGQDRQLSFPPQGQVSCEQQRVGPFCPAMVRTPEHRSAASCSPSFPWEAPEAQDAHLELWDRVTSWPGPSLLKFPLAFPVPLITESQNH